jgi:hypothetical protein
MTFDDDPSVQSKIPANWDVLREAIEDEGESPLSDGPADNDPHPIPTINLIAASWADGVSVVACCTAALVFLSLLGHAVTFSALPWAASLGAVWWVASALTLVVVRQGTPGMLLAGHRFAARIAAARIPGVILASAFAALLLGLPGLLGERRSPLVLAGGIPLEPVGID